MRTALYAAILLSMSVSTTRAQGPVKAEIGSALGLTISIPDDGSTLTTFGVPGAGTFIGSPTLYATFFATPSVMVEPQLNLNVIAGDGNTVWSTSLMGQLGYLLQPGRSGSGYVAAHVGLLAAGNGNSDTSQAAGLALGYRQVVGTGAAVRFEARYRRWFGNLVTDLNEITVGMAIGGLFR